MGSPVRTLGVVLFGASFLSGCALFNPYVPYDERTLDTVDLTTGTSTPGASGRHGDLAQERARGYQFASRLENAAAEHAEIRSAVALATIPMAGVATYKALASSGNGTTKLITKLAIGSAGIFGLAQSFENTQRAAVYLAGAKAVTCILGKTPSYKALDDDRLRMQTEELKKAVNETSAQLQLLSATADALAAAGIQIDRTALVIDMRVAGDVIDEAERVLATAYRYRKWSDEAGRVLYARMRDVALQIDDEIRKTEPDLNSVRNTLTSIAQKNVPIPLPPVPSTAATQPGLNYSLFRYQLRADGQAKADTPALEAAVQQLASLRSKLGPAVIDLGRKTQDFRALLVEVQAEASTTTQTDCAFVAPASSFAVSPSDQEVTLAIGKSKQFSVAGAIGTVRAMVVGTVTDKMVAAVSISGGFTVVSVEAKTGAPAGDYTLTIMDSTEANRRDIKLHVAQAS